jgi:ATP-dependent DNA helicase RecG
MFQLVGLGEQAGSGIPKIYRNWQQQHWRLPQLLDTVEPEQTLLAMLMVNLLPEETLTELDERFGSSFRELSDEQRLALATVAIEGKVTHTRLKCMTTTHPHDLTKALCALVKDGFLESDGASRGTFYFFPGEPPDIEADIVSQAYGLTNKKVQEDVLSGFHSEQASSDRLQASSDHLQASSDHLQVSSDHLQVSSDHLQVSSDHLQVSSDPFESLKVIAAPVREKGKVSSEVMEQTILQLCEDRFLTTRELGELLDNTPNYLRSRFLSKMVKAGQLELRYPDKPTHEAQAYGTQKSALSDFVSNQKHSDISPSPQ